MVSFDGSAIVTTGGALIANYTQQEKHAKHPTTTAKRPYKWAFVIMSWHTTDVCPILSLPLASHSLSLSLDFVWQRGNWRTATQRFFGLFSSEGAA
jgi:hypothetical protein